MEYVVRAFNWKGELEFEHHYKKQSDALNMVGIDINSLACMQVTITKEKK